jgi:hypothetical protein
MWTADIMGSFRGETSDVAKPGVWKFDPHAVVSSSYFFLSVGFTLIDRQVPFQPNQHDCGMHMLWHLKHIIEFGRILGWDESIGDLRFDRDMVGRRLRLAHELIAESTYE